MRWIPILCRQIYLNKMPTSSTASSRAATRTHDLLASSSAAKEATRKEQLASWKATKAKEGTVALSGVSYERSLRESVHKTVPPPPSVGKRKPPPTVAPPPKRTAPSAPPLSRATSTVRSKAAPVVPSLARQKTAPPSSTKSEADKSEATKVEQPQESAWALATAQAQMAQLRERLAAAQAEARDAGERCEAVEASAKEASLAAAEALAAEQALVSSLREEKTAVEASAKEASRVAAEALASEQATVSSLRVEKATLEEALAATQAEVERLAERGRAQESLRREVRSI